MAPLVYPTLPSCKACEAGRIVAHQSHNSALCAYGNRCERGLPVLFRFAATKCDERSENGFVFGDRTQVDRDDHHRFALTARKERVGERDEFSGLREQCLERNERSGEQRVKTPVEASSDAFPVFSGRISDTT